MHKPGAEPKYYGSYNVVDLSRSVMPYPAAVANAMSLLLWTPW